MTTATVSDWILGGGSKLLDEMRANATEQIGTMTKQVNLLFENGFDSKISPLLGAEELSVQCQNLSAHSLKHVVNHLVEIVLQLIDAHRRWCLKVKADEWLSSAWANEDPAIIFEIVLESIQTADLSHFGIADFFKRFIGEFIHETLLTFRGEFQIAPAVGKLNSTCGNQFSPDLGKRFLLIGEHLNNQ